MSEGIAARHRASCATTGGGRCTCSPSYRASVFDRRDGSRTTRTFATLAEAKRWRADTYREIVHGLRRAGRGRSLREAAEQLLDGMDAGTILNRSGDTYKPSAVRSYRTALELRILPAFGAARLGDVQRRDVQRLVDGLLAEGASPSTIRNTIMPLRVLFRRAIEDGDLATSPCSHLRMPAVRSTRERIASVDEMRRLLAALPADLEVLYATAFYAGLRRGELRGLRWDDLDLRRRRIVVRRGWDDGGRAIEPKSRMGLRTIPILPPLGDLLARHRREARAGVHVFYGRRPFTPSTVARRAHARWAAEDLRPIDLHECRHTFASLLIAAGVNAKAVSTFCGHSSIQVTFDLYGKLMPGSEDEAATLVTRYLSGYTIPDTTDTGNPHG